MKKPNECFVSLSIYYFGHELKKSLGTFKINSKLQFVHFHTSNMIYSFGFFFK